MIRYLLTLLLALSTSAYAVDVDVIREPLRTGTGTQDIEFSNFNEDCTAVTCAALFVLSKGSSNGVAADDAALAIGFTNGTTSATVMVNDEDGLVSSNSDRNQRANSELIGLYPSDGAGGHAVFSAWLSNGIRINVADDFAAQYLLTVVLFGGSGLQADVDVFLQSQSQNNPIDVITVGFEADLVFLAGVRLASTGDSVATTYLFSAGAAVNDGSSTQGSIGCFSGNGAAAGNPVAITSSLYGLQYVDNEGVDAAVEISGWDATGFTATTRLSGISADAGVAYLALNLGGLDAAIVDIQTPTSIGASSVSVGFQTLLGMVFGTLAQAYDTSANNSDGGACMISAATADAQYATFNTVEDAAATMNTRSVAVDRFIRMDQDDGTCNAGSCIGADLVSFGVTAWNLDYTHVFSGAGRRLIGLAIESPEIAPPISARRRIRPWGLQ